LAKRAVLLLAHGTPGNVDEIPEYLRNVVSGRPMPQSVIEEIQHRYSLIGEPRGHSPLTDLTMEQARLLQGGRGDSGVCGDAELAALHCRHCEADARGWGG